MSLDIHHRGQAPADHESPMSTAGQAKRRALPREVRREQLIKATISCIARNGLSGTTMGDVTREAGLSQGIANLHFQSKEKLLVATLSHLADEYNNGLAAVLEADYPSLRDRLDALVAFDFSSRVVQRNKLAVWFAFYGEARSRPLYQKICAGSDRATAARLRSVFEQAMSATNGNVRDLDLLTTGYTALVDGLWLDLLVIPRLLPRQRAQQVAHQYIAGAFPSLYSQ